MVPDCEKGESVGLEPAASNHGRLRVQCADASCARWRTAGPLHCWRTVRCLKHQAQGASDGRRARRLAESEPEPLEAHLVVRCTTARAGWSWRAASCQSRPISREARGLWRGVCRCAAPVPPNEREQQRKLRAPGISAPTGGGRGGCRAPQAAARTIWARDLKVQKIRFAGDGRTNVAKEKKQKKKPLRARLPAVVINPVPPLID